MLHGKVIKKKEIYKISNWSFTAATEENRGICFSIPDENRKQSGVRFLIKKSRIMRSMLKTLNFLGVK